MTYEFNNAAVGQGELYDALFDAMSGISYLIKSDAPNYTIVAATAQLLSLAGLKKADVVGRGVFEVFRSNPSDPADTGENKLRSSFAHVLQYKEPHQLPVQRYDVAGVDGSFEERYWRAENRPVFAPDGGIAYIIHSSEDITNQIQAQVREERMKGMEVVNNIFMQTPIPVCILKGSDLIIELANEPTLRLWGRTSDVIGQTLEETFPEEKGQGYSEMIREVIETGIAKEIYESPITLVRGGKSEIVYINYNYQPYYEKGQPTPVGVLAIGQDVTERTLLKEALAEKTLHLKESDEKLSSFLEAVPQIVWTNQPNGEIDFYNQQWFTYTGLNYQQSKEWGWQEVIHPDDLPSTMVTYTEKLQKGEEIVIENRFKRHDGQYRWQMSRAIPIKDGKGAIKFWLGICTDIHDRKVAEEALKQSESNLRNTILQAPVAICIFRGPQFVVEIANDKMYELWGRGKEEILGKSIFVGMPEVSNQGYEELLG
jgi:PAS domain S-box-containing protein